MQAWSSFPSSRRPAPHGVLHGADQRADGTAVATGIPRVIPIARAPPARPDGAGTGGAQKIKGKNKVYAVAKGFSTGIFESWAECDSSQSDRSDYVRLKYP